MKGCSLVSPSLPRPVDLCQWSPLSRGASWMSHGVQEWGLWVAKLTLTDYNQSYEHPFVSKNSSDQLLSKHVLWVRALAHITSIHSPPGPQICKAVRFLKAVSRVHSQWWNQELAWSPGSRNSYLLVEVVSVCLTWEFCLLGGMRVTYCLPTYLPSYLSMWLCGHTVLLRN